MTLFGESLFLSFPSLIDTCKGLSCKRQHQKFAFSLLSWLLTFLSLILASFSSPPSIHVSHLPIPFTFSPSNPPRCLCTPRGTCCGWRSYVIFLRVQEYPPSSSIFLFVHSFPLLLLFFSALPPTPPFCFTF